MEWIYKPSEGDDDAQIQVLVRELGLTEAIARLLIHRGYSDPAAAEHFLHPKLAHLDDPFNITHLAQAAERLVQAIENNQELTVLGDYDVDGVTSTTLLVSTLNLFGLKPKFFIPNRFEEGYGMTQEAVERALQAGKPDLFIALDCGTNSVDEVQFLKAQGIDVLIIDHHRSKEALPEGALLINPHVHDGEDQPWSQLCTVGLVFKLVHGLFKKLKDAGNQVVVDLKLKDFLDLVAMGTVADLVPLGAENRILTRFGLKKILNTERVGLQALCEVSGVSEKPILQPSDVGFRLGPRINASGRLADAILPVEMLLSADHQASHTIAQQLDAMNRERQEIERKVSEAASLQVTPEAEAGALALVAYEDDWHSGILGIVAGKLSRDFYRPALVLGSEGDLLKGSGRSISEVDLVQALGECEHLLEGWGGHPMAAGLSLKKSDFPEFKKAFQEAAGRQLSGELPRACLRIHEWLPLDALSDGFLEELQHMEPFGMGNPEPIFGLRQVVLDKCPKVFASEHFRFEVLSGNGWPVSGVAWRMAERVCPVGEPVDMAVKFGWNYWNGRRSPQLQLMDWRPAQN